MIMSYVRTIALYLVLIVCVRLMGKRQIGEMEPTEFVVTMLLANLAAIPMQDGAIPLYSGLVPILTVLGSELVLSGRMLYRVKFRQILRSVRLRQLLCGKPVILIENGKLVQDNLRRTRVTLDELTGHLREKDVLDITAVQYAILETDGNLSVFPFPKERPASAKDAGLHPKPQFLPVTIVEDGFLSRENLGRAGKDDAWLTQGLREPRAEIADTLRLTVDAGHTVVWRGKEYGR